MTLPVESTALNIAALKADTARIAELIRRLLATDRVPEVQPVIRHYIDALRPFDPQVAAVMPRIRRRMLTLQRQMKRRKKR